MAQIGAASRQPARALGWLLLLPLIAAALFGGNLLGVRDRVFPAPTKLSTTTLNNAAGQAVSGENELPAEPYWVPLTTSTSSGTGNGTTTVTIAADALQWKVDWQCDSGTISIDARRAGAASQPIAQAEACSGSGEGFGVDSGTFTLAITTSSRWSVSVQQELDRPQVSPPLPAMTAPGSALLASGTFYGIDQQGQGTVRIYRLADGSTALRLENFYVTPNTDFVIRLSPLPHPSSTPDFQASPSVDVALLPITAGSMNFSIPSNIDPRAYHSVVIWCQRLISAYAGATLQPA